MNKEVRDLLKAHNLDFTIVKQALGGIDESYVTNGKIETKHIAATPYFGLFNSKTGECLNTCKAGYTPSQNAKVVELVLEGIKPFGKDLSVYKAGALQGGRKVFIQLEVNGLSKLAGGDTIKRYVTVIDSNDGSTGLSVGIGDLTMSCQNQFFKFYKKGEAKFRHTKTLTEKIQTIPTLIQYALDESIQQVKVYKEFQSTPLSRGLADKMVKEILGHDRTTEKEFTGKAMAHMNSLYEAIADQIKDKGENLWGLHSGVTKWTTHNRLMPKNDNGLEETLMIGKSYDLAQKSFGFAVKELGYLVGADNMLLV